MTIKNKKSESTGSIHKLPNISPEIKPMGILILLIKQGLPFKEKNQLCIIYMYKTDILLLLKKEIQLISCYKHFNETNKIKQNPQKRHEPLTSLYKVKIMQRSVCLCIKHIPLQDHTSVPAPPPIPSPSTLLKRTCKRSYQASTSTTPMRSKSTPLHCWLTSMQNP